MQDCAGVWGGSTLVDECGVCDGEGAVYECGCSDPDENYDCDGNCVVEIDCAGACGGNTAVDECGVCGGSGILEGACDCEGNVLDGCGVCGGEADGADCNYDGVDDVCEDEYDTAYESGLLDGFDDGATSGDLNLDGFHNVSDIVLAVELILTGE